MSVRYIDILRKAPSQDRIHLRILLRTQFDNFRTEVEKGPKKIEYPTWNITLNEISDLEDLLRIMK